MENDLRDVIAEVKTEFERYEQALVSNDVAALNKLFHNDPRTIRYGGSENLYGYSEIAAFRAARSPLGLARALSRTVIVIMGATVPLPRRFIIGRMRPEKLGARCRPGYDSQKNGGS